MSFKSAFKPWEVDSAEEKGEQEEEVDASSDAAPAAIEPKRTPANKHATAGDSPLSDAKPVSSRSSARQRPTNSRAPPARISGGTSGSSNTPPQDSTGDLSASNDDNMTADRKAHIDALKPFVASDDVSYSGAISVTCNLLFCYILFCMVSVRYVWQVVLIRFLRRNTSIKQIPSVVLYIICHTGFYFVFAFPFTIWAVRVFASSLYLEWLFVMSLVAASNGIIVVTVWFAAESNSMTYLHATCLESWAATLLVAYIFSWSTLFELLISVAYLYASAVAFVCAMTSLSETIFADNSSLASGIHVREEQTDMDDADVRQMHQRAGSKRPNHLSFASCYDYVLCFTGLWKLIPFELPQSAEGIRFVRNGNGDLPNNESIIVRDTTPPMVRFVAEVIVTTLAVFYYFPRFSKAVSPIVSVFATICDWLPFVVIQLRDVFELRSSLMMRLGAYSRTVKLHNLIDTRTMLAGRQHWDALSKVGL